MSTDARKLSFSTVIPIVVTALTVLVGLWQYVQTRQGEFRKRYWEEQMRWYSEATQAAATIATAASLEETVEARRTFWQLYWGKLALIESREVEQAMLAFGLELSACEQDAAKCFEQSSDISEPTPLRRRSYELAHCAAYSLTQTWNPTSRALDARGDNCPHVARTPPARIATPGTRTDRPTP